MMIVAVFRSCSEPISNNAFPVNIRSGVKLQLFGVIITPFPTLQFFQLSLNGANSLPEYIRISRLHSGGISCPASQRVTVLTLLKHKWAV